jgi:hypothetical protein
MFKSLLMNQQFSFGRTWVREGQEASYPQAGFFAQFENGKGKVR